MHRSIHTFLLGSALSALPANGQTPVFLGTIGLHADEVWGSVVITGATTDTNGDSYIVGEFTGTVTLGTTTIQSTQYGSDVFVAKLGADGTWDWVSRMSGTMYGSGHGAAIALDGTGGLYFSAGLLPDSLSYNGTAVPLTGPGGLCLVKLDTSGAWQWIAESDAPDVNLLVCDPLGNAYVGGQWNPGGVGEIHIGGDTLAGGWDIDMYLAKVDASGSWSWGKNFTSIGGTQEILLEDIAVGLDGNLIAGGYVHGTHATFDGYVLWGNPLNDDAYHMLPFVGKWAPDGTLLWMSGLSTEHQGGFEMESLELDANGGAQILGVAHDTADFAPYQVIADGWTQVLVSIDADGNWTSVAPNEQYGGWVSDMVRMDSTTMACVGMHNQPTLFGEDSLQWSGANDVFATLVSSDGSWLGGVGGGSVDEDRVRHVTIGGGLLRAFGTAFGSPAIFGTDTLISPNGVSSFISTLDVSSVGVQEQASGLALSFFAYPVPATNAVTINSNLTQVNEPYVVLDQLGRQIMSGRLNGTRTTFSVMDLMTGCYVLRSGVHSARFIKE